MAVGGRKRLRQRKERTSDYSSSGLETGLVAAGTATTLVGGLVGLVAGSVILGEGREGRDRVAPLTRPNAQPSAVELRQVGLLWTSARAPAGVSLQLGF